MATIPLDVKTGTLSSLVQCVKSELRRYAFAYLVLVAVLLISAVATFYVKASVDNNAKAEFIAHSNELHHEISGRFDDHARILRSGAALFDATELVTRETWRIFTHSQQLEKQQPGIPAEDLERIFQPFIQQDGSSTRKYDGAGLGLTISKHLTELMGGTISVESSTSGGSSFTVRIPFSGATD